MRRVFLAGLCAVLVAAVVAHPTAATARTREITLWVVDDVTKVTYQVSELGALLASFPTPNTAISSIAVDPRDGTLWGANEGTGDGSVPGKLVNYDRNGVVIREISAADFGAVGTEGMGLTFDRRNPTLWVVDDPPAGTGVPMVYNIDRDGDLISSFPTSDFDVAATSPQAIDYDRFTQSLWITDNAAERVYNVGLTGELIASFPTDGGPFVTEDFPGGITNIQGVSVGSADDLWITARDTGTVYQVSRAGDVVLQSFPIAAVDPLASDPTGVAVDIPRRVRG